MNYLEAEDKIVLNTQEAISFSLLRYTGFGAEDAYPCRRLTDAERKNLGLSEIIPLQREFEAGEHGFLLTGEADKLATEGRTIVLRLFFAYFFLARQKKVCPRSDSCGRAMITALRCNRRSVPRLRRGRLRAGRAPLHPRCLCGLPPGLWPCALRLPRRVRRPRPAARVAPVVW